MDNEIKKYIKAGRINLIVIYILFLCGVVAPLLPAIGVIFAYLNKDVPDKNLSSHYIFIVRTFYISCISAIIYMCINFMSFVIFPFMFFLNTVIYTCLCIWYILRVVIGFKYLLNCEPHSNYMTYWIK